MLNKNNNACISLLFLALLTGSALADLGGAVTTISGKDLESLDNRNIADVLSDLPGTAIGPRYGDSGGADIRIRGTGPRDSGPLIIIDGVPQPSDGSATGGLPDHLTPDSISRVEVLKGASATALYGSRAAQGVINIVTKKGAPQQNPGDSWLLTDTQRILSENWIALQSEAECDATEGELKPGWTYQPRINFGLPKFGESGYTFGDVRGGYTPAPDVWRDGGSASLPNIGVPRPRLGGLPALPLSGDPLANLAVAVNAHPHGTAAQKQQFLAEIEAAADAVGGIDNLIAQELFDIDRAMQRFRDRVDPDPSATTATTPGASTTTLPDAASTTTAPNASAQTSFTQFDRLVERISSHADATDAQRKQFIAQLLFYGVFAGQELLSDGAIERGLFRPDEVFQDFLSKTQTPATATPASGTTAAAAPASPPRTAPPNPFERYVYPPDYAFDFSICTEEQKQKLQQLIRERDQARADMSYYMDYLRAEEQSAEATREDMEHAEAARTVRGEKNHELQELWEQCVNPADSRQAQAPDAAADENTDGVRSVLGDVAMKPGEGYTLELHVQRPSPSGSGRGEPVPDLGVTVKPYNADLKIDLPFGLGAVRDIDTDAALGSDRKFTGQDGVVELKIEGDAPATPPAGLGSGVAAAPATGYGADDYGSDWRLGVGYGDGGLARIKMKLDFSKVDGVVQEFPNAFDGMNTDDIPTIGGLQSDARDDATDEDAARSGELNDWSLHAGARFRVGRSLYQTYTYPETATPNFSGLDKFKGQAGYTNDTCGDSAVPPEGVGYTPAALAAVQSVNDQWAMKAVGVPDAQAAGAPIIVGIIDTGLDWNHADLSWDQIWRNEKEIPGNGIDDDNNGYVDDIIGWDFLGNDNKPWDHDGHGTFVAGLIAATPNNDIGIDGINPNARIMVLKALNNFGRTRASYVARAIVYGVDNGAKVLNLSVSGSGFPRVVQHAIDYAEERGVLVVLAAGNRGEDIANSGPRPLQHVMYVAASDVDGNRTPFSNYGEQLSVTAPGVDIVSLRARRTDFLYSTRETVYVPGDAFIGDDNRYYRATGTSFSAPIVSGIASLVWSQRPQLSLSQLRRILQQSARDAGTPGHDILTGYGIVDAAAAIKADPEVFVEAAITDVRRLDAQGRVYLQVMGRGDANRFRSAYVEMGDGEDPASWQRVSAPVMQAGKESEILRISAIDLIGKPAITVKLVVENASGERREARRVISLD